MTTGIEFNLVVGARCWHNSCMAECSEKTGRTMRGLMSQGGSPFVIAPPLLHRWHDHLERE
jgi:hypothetical protein